MKQIFVKKGEVVVEDVPTPICAENEILVRTAYSLISAGSEKQLLQSSHGALSLLMEKPKLLKKVLKQFQEQGFGRTKDVVISKLEKLTPVGYSSSGIVVEVGKNVKEFSKGDRVACGGMGYANHAEYVCVPKNLAVLVPKNVSLEEAAFTTVGAIAMQGVRRSDAKLEENVVVIGLGLLGLLTIQILKAAGCNVIGLDIFDYKVKLGKKLGLDFGINSRKQDPVKAVERYTKGLGADSVIITAATKSNEPLIQAAKMCRKKGKVVIVGTIGMEVPRDLFYKKELDLLVSTSYGPGRYDSFYEEKGVDYPLAYVRWTENRNMKSFLDLISKDKVNVKNLISKTFAIENAKDAYASLEEKIGILFKYGEGEQSKKIRILSKPRKKGKIKVALIGAGEFAKSVHLPNLKKIEDYEIYAIVSRTPENAKAVAKQYEAKYSTTDYKEVLKDKNVDVVLISTRHNLHAPLAIAAVKAKKDIFLEKPMAMNDWELKKLLKALNNSKINFVIGFNRRFSPLSLKAKEALEEKFGPTIINYVVNARPLPNDHWLYDSKEGGGRVIGEACHFFDFFNFIIDSEPIEISAKSISGEGINTEDNFVSQIKYRDGSLANLIYNTIGSEKLPKERIEIMKGEGTIIINDFKELRFYNFKERDVFLRIQDKGHFNELLEFAKIIKGNFNKKISLDQFVKATRISFEVLEKIKK